eukprot:6184663-Pleurochrysis_carterae.AAC.3
MSPAPTTRLRWKCRRSARAQSSGNGTVPMEPSGVVRGVRTIETAMRGAKGGHASESRASARRTKTPTRTASVSPTCCESPKFRRSSGEQ